MIEIIFETSLAIIAKDAVLEGSVLAGLGHQWRGGSIPWFDGLYGGGSAAMVSLFDVWIRS